MTVDHFEHAWRGFTGDQWRTKASVAAFVRDNYRPYDGDESFLAGPTDRTLTAKRFIDETKAKLEADGFVYDTRPSSITIPAGVLPVEEVIYGIQNDELFKLNFMPKGGIRMAEAALKEHGFEPDHAVHELYTGPITTVNDAIFRAYTTDIKRSRHSHLVSGLPDA